MIPKFAVLYNDLNINLPQATRILLASPSPTGPICWERLACCVLALLAAFAWSRSEQGGLALERVRMRLAAGGRDDLTKFQFAQFCRTLSTLLAGGTPLVQAMETSGGAISSRLVSGAITRGAQLVREGQSLHDGLARQGLVPDLALEMIEVGEASGALAPMLASVAEFYEDDVNTQLTNLVALDRAGDIDFHGNSDRFYPGGAVFADVFVVHGRPGAGIELQ